MKKLFFLLVPVVLFTAACGSSNSVESEPMTEAATAPVAETVAEGGVEIALVSPVDGTVPMGDAELVLEVMDPATNEPVALGNLQVDLSMPMDGMEPMTTMAIVEAGEQPGQYKVMTNLGMEGLWMMAVTSADPAMQGEATFNLEVK